MIQPKRKKMSKYSRVERFLYKSCLIMIITLVVGIIFSQTTLSNVNLQLEKLKINLSKQEDTNQSLVMKINEMASLENIQTVARSMGLAYNNENVKTISE